MLAEYSLQCEIDRHRSPRVLSLRFVSSAVHPGAANLQLALLPVEVTPLQPENLTDAQPQTACQYAHCSVRLWDVLKNFSELLDRQHGRLTYTLRHILYPHEAHGIELIRYQLPSHRTVKDHPHLILQVPLALRCEVESLGSITLWHLGYWGFVFILQLVLTMLFVTVALKLLSRKEAEVMPG